MAKSVDSGIRQSGVLSSCAWWRLCSSLHLTDWLRCSGLRFLDIPVPPSLGSLVLHWLGPLHFLLPTLQCNPLTYLTHFVVLSKFESSWITSSNATALAHTMKVCSFWIGDAVVVRACLGVWISVFGRRRPWPAPTPGEHGASVRSWVTSYEGMTVRPALAFSYEIFELKRIDWWKLWKIPSSSHGQNNKSFKVAQLHWLEFRYKATQTCWS